MKKFSLSLLILEFPTIHLVPFTRDFLLSKLYFHNHFWRRKLFSFCYFFFSILSTQKKSIKLFKEVVSRFSRTFACYKRHEHEFYFLCSTSTGGCLLWERKIPSALCYVRDKWQLHVHSCFMHPLCNIEKDKYIFAKKIVHSSAMRPQKCAWERLM